MQNRRIRWDIETSRNAVAGVAADVETRKELPVGPRCRSGWAWFVALAWAGTLMAAQISLASSSRTYVDLDADWRFSRGDFATATGAAFDDSGWRRVNLPHDWSIEGPFGPEYGSGNGYAPGGIGWYRRHFTSDIADKDRLVAIEFDGVYDHAEVWINGHFVGGRPYGYSSFQCDLTPLLRFGTGENVVAVRVDHSRFADSRWYTGSGIYRHVRLRITDKLRIAHWGTYVTTPEVTGSSATVRVETAVENGSGGSRAFSLQVEAVGSDGQVAGVAEQTAAVEAGKGATIVQQITLTHPQLWSPQSPTLYTLRSRLTADAAAVDETSTTFGIRTLRFDPDKGFFLNGKPMKIKGVCIHHDAGCLGSAVPDKVLERRLRLLKELGANAIRTSHNPPAPELLDFCDRLGLLVKDEAFDEFTPAKNKWVSGRNVGQPSRFGYAELFDQWSVVDAQDMVRRDRNHPCVIMWSIGNEIDYPNDPFSHPVLGNQYRPANPPAQDLVRCAKPLVEAVKKLDTTRPVAAALANVAMSDAVGLSQLLDVVGYNYQEARYAADHRKYPQRFIFGSENGHQFNNWAVVQDNDYVAGQFLWTGIDYLGEANRWPNRGSSAGLLDVCGFKKPNAWFRQNLWSDKPMVYLCAGGAGRRRGMGFRGPRGEEHWNWSGGTSVTVICYTNCPEVRLTLNDQEIGTKRWAEAANGVLTWQVPFAPGVLKAVGLNGGKILCEFALTTAGPARRIALLPDVAQIRPDGKDICHVEFRIVDGKDVLVPDGEQEVTFDVSGPAVILGIGNADLNSPDSYQDHVHRACQGRGLAILQSTMAPGSVILKAAAPGLESATLALVSR
jgi:beta-galactosidase